MNPELKSVISQNVRVRRGLHLVGHGLEEIMLECERNSALQYEAADVQRNFEGVAMLLGVDLSDRGVMEVSDPETGDDLLLTDTGYDELVLDLRRRIVESAMASELKVLMIMEDLKNLERDRRSFLADSPGERKRNWPEI